MALKSAVANLDALRNETFALQRDLLHERTKVRFAQRMAVFCSPTNRL